MSLRSSLGFSVKCDGVPGLVASHLGEQPQWRVYLRAETLTGSLV